MSGPPKTLSYVNSGAGLAVDDSSSENGFDAIELNDWYPRSPSRFEFIEDKADFRTIDPRFASPNDTELAIAHGCYSRDEWRARVCFARDRAWRNVIDLELAVEVPRM